MSITIAERNETVVTLEEVERNGTAGAIKVGERNGTVGTLEEVERNGTAGALEEVERNGTAGALEEVERNGTAGALEEVERNGTGGGLEGVERNGTAGALEEVERNATAGALEEVERNGTAGALEEVERNGTAGALEEVERNGTAGALEEVERNGTAGALEEAERNGTAGALELEDEATDYVADQDTGHDAPPQAHPIRLGEYPHAPDAADTADRPEGGPALAVFCYEDPDGFVGQYVSWFAGLVAARGTPVHLFGRRPFAEGTPGVHNHPVGDCGDDPLGSVREFTRRNCDAFGRAFPLGAAGVTLPTHERSAVQQGVGGRC